MFCTLFVLALLLVIIGIFLISIRTWVRLTSGIYQITTDLSGINFYITGCTAGLGLETARELARHNGRVFMMVRRLERGLEIAEGIKQETGNFQVFVLQCNLSSLKSVRECAKQILASEEKIDVLLNNAGMGGSGPSTREKTEDGLNQVMQSNHFGHFLLTNLLLARIINVSSLLHLWATDIDIDDLNCENKDSTGKMSQLYAWSKLANVLFTKELAKRLQGTRVTSNCLHPGAIVTQIGKERSHTGYPTSTTGAVGYIWSMMGPIVKTANEGIQTHLYLSISPEVNNVSGHYFADCKPAVTALNGLDDKLAAQLWEKSVGFTKLY